MSIANFEIISYEANLSGKDTSVFGASAITTLGSICCFGVDGHKVIVNFIPNNTPEPLGRIGLLGKAAILYLHVETMPLWLDTLRNEKPIYGHINSDRPNESGVRTGLEFVGEDEH